MIGIERKAQAANLGIRNTMLGQDTDPKKARLQGDAEDGAMKEVRTPLGRTKCPKFLVSGTFWVLVAIIAVFAVLLAVPIMDRPEQQNCLALVVFVSLLWATEVSLHGRVEAYIRSDGNPRQSPCSSHHCWYRSSALSCKSYGKTISPTGDYLAKKQLVMSSPPCGHRSSCCYLVASPSPQP